MEIQLKKQQQQQQQSMKVKWIHHSPGCSLNIMSTINVNHQNSQADFFEPITF